MQVNIKNDMVPLTREAADKMPVRLVRYPKTVYELTHQPFSWDVDTYDHILAIDAAVVPKEQRDGKHIINLGPDQTGRGVWNIDHRATTEEEALKMLRFAIDNQHISVTLLRKEAPDVMSHLIKKFGAKVADPAGGYNR